MRDYINRLSRGNSIIKVPKLSCSEEQITMDIMCNTVATGSFICDATDKVYGMVYADNERVKIFSEQFGGTHIITEYQVDASGLEETASPCPAGSSRRAREPGGERGQSRPAHRRCGRCPARQDGCSGRGCPRGRRWKRPAFQHQIGRASCRERV